jgi:site-specific DNA-methyltransferase (adenine-specific)
MTNEGYSAVPDWRLIPGDCRDALAELADSSIDAVVTDPPYELGFMGKGWDAAGIAYDASMWAEVLRVLKPGGYLLAFGGTRTYHRMTCAIEDAGFEIRDSINWLYGCLTDDVEVLTEHGWVAGTDVTVGDRIAQWEPVTGVVSLAPVEDTFRAPWDGPLVAFRNSDTDQLLTPNHRVFWQRNAHRSANNIEFREWVTECSEAADVPRRSQIRLPLAGVHDGPGIGGTDYAALLGWVWAEGHFDAKGTGVRIYQSSVNQPECDTIAGLMDRMGAHKRYDRDRVYKDRTYTESTWFFSGDLARRVRADLPSKHPTYELLWRMSAAEIEAFYEAAIAGDGHVTKSGSATFEQKDPLDREWFVTLLALSNRRGHDYARPRGGGSVSVTRSPWTNLSPGRMAETEQVFYTGDVWCVKVPSGAFVARRNGKVFVTGNSGFPKSLDVSKAIDKAAGAERKVVGARPLTGNGKTLRSGFHQPDGTGAGETIKQDVYEFTAPATPEAEKWEGWGTALKPAHEPIVVARKPLIGTVAANVLKWGTGALNIDGCRVGGANGRWPANVVLTHHVDCRPAGTAEETVGGGEAGTSGFAAGYESGDGFVGRTVGATVWDCHPECPAAVMDGQSGDSGGPSRYFTQTGWDDELDGTSFLYQAKANKKERNAGLDDTEGKTIGAKGNGLARTCATCGASVIDGCDCPDRTYVNPVRKNFHPTVKPVELMRWLIRLVTPPDGTVLDPFTGSGTTGIAATLEGFHFIGIEQDADYIEQIARPRILHHLHTTLDYATVSEPATKPDDPVNPPDDQPTLF